MVMSKVLGRYSNTQENTIIDPTEFLLYRGIQASNRGYYNAALWKLVPSWNSVPQVNIRRVLLPDFENQVSFIKENDSNQDMNNVQKLAI